MGQVNAETEDIQNIGAEILRRIKAMEDSNEKSRCKCGGLMKILIGVVSVPFVVPAESSRHSLLLWA